MSSTESSGAPAEATATTPASDAAFPTFGSTRGSGLARGKRPSTGPAPTTVASTAYTPTAIEVINAPREYTNPFAPAEPEPAAPVETPAVQTPAPVVIQAAPAAPDLIEEPAPITESAPADEVNEDESADQPTETSAKVELNILEPEQQKSRQAQTWESEGFRPTREPRSERPRREARPERNAEPFDPASIPEKFLYVRPGHTYVPTPSNFGGATRERKSASRESSPTRSSGSTAPAQKSGGFFGWLKSLFGSSSPAPVTTGDQPDAARREDGGQRRHRGGRNRSSHGEGGGQRRNRGGRGRSGGGYRGERSGGGQGGSSAS